MRRCPPDLKIFAGLQNCTAVALPCIDSSIDWASVSEIRARPYNPIWRSPTDLKIFAGLQNRTAVVHFDLFGFGSARELAVLGVGYVDPGFGSASGLTALEPEPEYERTRLRTGPALPHATNASQVIATSSKALVDLEARPRFHT
ncbi:hypothetical protein C8R46DRAFT_1218324 [Mycena filopes]|nr:hypothetical protein C8R46DRAFT_1218324 [Mycena filopes]